MTSQPFTVDGYESFGVDSADTVHGVSEKGPHELILYLGDGTCVTISAHADQSIGGAYLMITTMNRRK